LTNFIPSIFEQLLKRLYPLQSYIKFRTRSKNRHSVHSPFVFDMCQKVLRVKKQVIDTEEIEVFRKEFLQSDEIISVEDLGAGSKSISPHQCEMMSRLIAYYKPDVILEIGTSLGISTAYMAKSNTNAIVYTMEGSENIILQASSLFKKLRINNIQPILGNFDERLPILLEDLSDINFAFIDGNHTYENTVNYFNQILTKSNNDTIIVIDDIYWSKPMTKAWKEIKDHERTRTTIDLYYFGIVLLREEMSKEHFMLKY